MKTKNQLPKTCKFKPVAARDLIIQAGLVTNKHWLFKIDWLMGLNPARSLRFQALKNRVIAAQVQATKDRLAGKESSPWTPQVEKVFNSHSLEGYAPLDMDKISFSEGYFKGRYDSPAYVIIAFSERAAPILDIEYSAALFFDPDAQAYFKNESAPVAIVRGGVIVGLIMPLNKKSFQRKGKSENEN